MSDLLFCSPGSAPASSPLARALAGARDIVDLSPVGKLEVRGAGADGLALDADVIPITPTRALVVCPNEERAELARSLPGLVVDVTSAYAAIEVRGEALLRRLTDLDLESLPASGKVAGVPALLTRNGDAFRILFAQEYGDSVVELVRDVQKGLA
jgi:hypothetical protein